MPPDRARKSWIRELEKPVMIDQGYAVDTENLEGARSGYWLALSRQANWQRNYPRASAITFGIAVVVGAAEHK